AAEAPVVGHSNELVPVEHHTVIGGGAVFVGPGCGIGSTERVQNREAVVRPDPVDHTVAIRTAVGSRRVQSAIGRGCQSGSWIRSIPIVTGRIDGAETVHS